jgi:hypothetical protein
MLAITLSSDVGERHGVSPAIASRSHSSIMSSSTMETPFRQHGPQQAPGTMQV